MTSTHVALLYGTGAGLPSISIRYGWCVVVSFASMLFRAPARGGCLPVHVCTRMIRTVRRYGWTVRLDREGGYCPDREMRIVSVYELSGVGEQIAQSN